MHILINNLKKSYNNVPCTSVYDAFDRDHWNLLYADAHYEL